MDVLSVNSKRKHYDEMLRLEFSIEDAHKIFEDFFGEHGIVDEEEEKFFNTHYPERARTNTKFWGFPEKPQLRTSKRPTESWPEIPPQKKPKQLKGQKKVPRSE